MQKVDPKPSQQNLAKSSIGEVWEGSSPAQMALLCVTLQALVQGVGPGRRAHYI